MKPKQAKRTALWVETLEKFGRMSRLEPGEKATIIFWGALIIHGGAVPMAAGAYLLTDWLNLVSTSTIQVLQLTGPLAVLDFIVYRLLAYFQDKIRRSNGILLLAAVYFLLSILPLFCIIGIFSSITWLIIVTCSAFAMLLLGAKLATAAMGTFFLLIFAVSLVRIDGNPIVRYQVPLQHGEPLWTSSEVIYMWTVTVIPFIVAFGALVVYLSQTYSRESELLVKADQDPLTKLRNRRSLDQELDKIVQSAQNQGRPLAVALLDLDHFKQINDRYGHPVGDQALIHIADLLRSSTRDRDLVGRYGGEEFLLALPDCSAGDAYVIVDRLRQRIAASNFRLDTGEQLSLTTSGGLAALEGAETPDALIAQADEALYLAKESGRNRIETAADADRTA